MSIHVSINLDNLHISGVLKNQENSVADLLPDWSPGLRAFEFEDGRVVIPPPQALITLKEIPNG